MCHVIPNITFHAFCCSKSALRFFRLFRKCTSMHHILHNDLHFSHRTCHANPAGTVILQVFRYTNLRFLTKFTTMILQHSKHGSTLLFESDSCLNRIINNWWILLPRTKNISNNWLEHYNSQHSGLKSSWSS